MLNLFQNYVLKYNLYVSDVISIKHSILLKFISCLNCSITVKDYLFVNIEKTRTVYLKITISPLNIIILKNFQK